MSGKYPSVPNTGFPTVHVSDVARAHILAMEKFDIADGNRFILAEKTYSFLDIFLHLQDFRKYGYKVPNKVMSKCTFNFASIFFPKLRSLKKIWGRKINTDGTKIQEMLGL